jgi:NAD(P)H-hydrate epimerase
MGVASSPEALLQKALQLAEASSSYVVLKGHSTAICTPSGEAYFNTTGNTGMATAGAGDVLTGMLTSFLAQGYPPLSACIIGVYLHGLAGDKAEQNFCQHTLTASDIINHLHHAFKECTQGLAQHPFL